MTRLRWFWVLHQRYCEKFQVAFDLQVAPWCKQPCLEKIWSYEDSYGKGVWNRALVLNGRTWFSPNPSIYNVFMPERKLSKLILNLETLKPYHPASSNLQALALRCCDSRGVEDVSSNVFKTLLFFSNLTEGTPFRC